MTKESIQGLSDVKDDAVTALKQYFHAAIQQHPAGGNPVEDKKLPDRALILLGRVNGMESTRLKAIALQFQIAKHMGLQGEPLRPLLVELNPENFPSGPMITPADAAAITPPSAGVRGTEGEQPRRVGGVLPGQAVEGGSEGSGRAASGS